MTKPIQIKGLMIGEGIPKVCVPLTGKTQEAVCREAEDARNAGADLVEWRADFYAGLLQSSRMQELLERLSGILGEIPLLFTIRTKEEGGNLKLAPEEYERLNLAAAKSGCADLIDVEVFGNRSEKKALIERIHAEGARVVGSSHDFEKTDDEETLLKRFQEIHASGADILKMAVMPEEFEDVAAIMRVTHEMTKKYTEKPVISMAMGSLGSISRISGENFGSSVTFGTVGAASAPGQFPIAELRLMMQSLHSKNTE